MIHALFFDFNGVIIDDERIHLQAYRQVLADEAIELADEEYFACLGMDDLAFTRAAFARAGRDVDDLTARTLIDREHEKHRSLITQNLPLAPGIVDFTKAAAHEFQLGIVSMAERSEIDFVLALAGLTDSFSVIVSAEPALKHKPAPDCYQRALTLLNEKRHSQGQPHLRPAECLVIEDAPPGIEAARAAGMHTLAVTNTVSESLLRASGAEVVTGSLADWNADAVHLLYD